MSTLRTVLAAAVAAGALVATPPSPAAAADDTADEPVYLVKGYGQDLTEPPSQWSCATRWSKAIRAMRRRGWEGRFVRVGFYKQDTPATGCDVNVGIPGSGEQAGTQEGPLRELGRRLAWNIYNEHSHKGESVDIVGHSMGGLVARAAIAGYARREKGWPPKLLVEDAVTLGAPHGGSTLARLCFTRQCKDMRAGSDFLRWLSRTPNPQADGGTDWTLIAAEDDGVAGPGSAAPAGMRARHRVIYAEDQDLGHSELRKAVSGRYRMTFFNDGRRGSRPDGASPIQATQNSLFWATRW